MSDQHHHRSLFSSKNRPFKGKSKGKAEKVNRGKVDNGSALASGRSSFSVASSKASGAHNAGQHRIPIKHSHELATKDARYNQARQMQKNSREDLFQKKRIGARQGPPKCIALVALGAHVDLSGIVTAISAYAAQTQEGVAEEMKAVEKSSNPLLHTIAVKSVKRARSARGSVCALVWPLLAPPLTVSVFPACV